MATACAICGSDRIEPLIARRDTPVFQNAVYADAAAAKAAPRGDLDFRRCQACGFVWDAAFSSDRLAYSPAYENRQSLSPAFDAHLKRRGAAPPPPLGASRRGRRPPGGRWRARWRG